MKDDLEKQLDEFYRGLDAPARRAVQKWKPRTRRHAPSRARNAAMWITLGAASAAALLLILLYQPSDPQPQAPPKKETAKKESTPPPREIPRDLTKREEPKKDTPKEEPKKEEKIVEVPRKKETPEKEEPKKEDEPKPKTEPKTETEEVLVKFVEVEGTFEVGGKAHKGRQKDFSFKAGERIEATSITKLTLADRRFLLLAPKTHAVVSTEPERLLVKLEQGEILAELIGAGGAVRVRSGDLDIDHVGTVFSVRVEGKRTVVQVEEGSVQCGAATVRAGQQFVSGGKVEASDLRRLAWARAHRPQERELFVDRFDAAGKWEAEVKDGLAKGLPDPGWCGAKVRLESPGLFAVPVRGKIAIEVRADRATKLVVQLHAVEPRLNFLVETRVTRGNVKQTIVVDFDKFLPTEKSKRPMDLPAGAPIEEIYLQFGEDGDKVNVWVDSIEVIETRP